MGDRNQLINHTNIMLASSSIPSVPASFFVLGLYLHAQMPPNNLRVKYVTLRSSPTHPSITVKFERESSKNNTMKGESKNGVQNYIKLPYRICS